MVVVALLATTPPVQALPSEASGVGEEHAGTHGPDGRGLYRPGRAPADHPYEVEHPAAWDPAQYDGLAPTSDQADVVAGPSVHAIYLYPSNGQSRFSEFAAMFQADASQASALLENLYGSGVRFDMRTGAPTTLNPDGVFLDITVVRSKYNARQLASELGAVIPSAMWDLCACFGRNCVAQVRMLCDAARRDPSW